MTIQESTGRSGRRLVALTAICGAVALAVPAVATGMILRQEAPAGPHSQCRAGTAACPAAGRRLRASAARAAARPQAHRLTARQLRSRSAQRALALGATPCADGSGALCGSYTVALDWLHPDGRTASIDFKLFVHSAPGAAVSTIWWNGGGPGPSTTRTDGFVPDFVFGDLQETFDLLFVDMRGTGSTAPACPALQTFNGIFPSAAADGPIADCAASIADRIDTYGSATSARDLDALRAALGIAKLDLVGNSYGAVPATAYALRFPQRVRSIVLSSGVDPVATLRQQVLDTAVSSDRITRALCDRFAACRAGIPDVRAALARGVRRLRRHPVEGRFPVGNDPTPRRVKLTEATLFILLNDSEGTFLSVAGQAPAALVALGHGDKRPALRLAAYARAEFTFPGDEPPAEEDSLGGNFAISCSDARKPWRDGLTPAQRVRAAARSLRGLRSQVTPWQPPLIARDRTFANWYGTEYCNRWVDTHAEPVIPRHARYPHLPVLVLTSDLDTLIPREVAERVVKRWPDGQLFDVGGGLHSAVFWSCGPDTTRAFLRDPGAPLAPCDPTQVPAFRAVPEFPRTSAQATPLAVDPTGNDASTRRDRKLAAAALEVALDANDATNHQFTGLGPGVGLRGGAWTSAADDSQFRVDFAGARFTADVAVTGNMVFPFDGSTPTIDITFRADDGTTGSLSVVANWTEGRPVDSPEVVPVRGTIGGRSVALLLPL